MANIDTVIAELETKLKQAKAKKQQTEALIRTLEQKRKRTEDTRRKVLVGAILLAKVERGEWPKERLIALLAGELTRDDDRVLFGLAPLDPQRSESHA